MKILNEIVEISTRGQGLYEFTQLVEEFVEQSEINEGTLNLYCRHTSCSLTIQENADPDVQADLVKFFKLLVPHNMDWVTHTMEGADDMPAHIKSALTATSLTVPIIEGRVMLGTWQGIYLFEHRDAPHVRQIIVQIIGG